MLLGGRGQTPLDLQSLATMISDLSRLAVDRPDLSVEINPVFVYPRGYAVADFRGVALKRS
jgi:succinyl-CoA synthetase beta subunit